MGAPCRAVYSEDGVIYEAIISKIYENKTCIVKFVGNIFSMIAVHDINQEIQFVGNYEIPNLYNIFLFTGYGNTEKVQLNSLLESEGLQSQIAQQKKALEEKFNEENDETGKTNFSTNDPKKYNGEKMDCESEETRSYKHQFVPGPSFNSIADIMPPAPPLPPQLMAK